MTGDQLLTILTLLDDRERVIIVNAAAPRRWVEKNNELIERIAADHPNTVVADWSSVANEPSPGQNPPSTWSVHVTNRALMPVNSVTLAAAVVDVNGKVKATQALAAIKNLKPQQVIRKEIPVRVTVIAPTDRVVFYVKEIKSETGDWKSVDADVAGLIASVAAQLPVP